MQLTDNPKKLYTGFRLATYFLSRKQVFFRWYFSSGETLSLKVLFI